MDSADDVVLQVTATNQFAQACWNNAAFGVMRQTLEARLPIADTASIMRLPTGAFVGVAVTFRALLTAVHAQLGDFDCAERHGRDARRIADSTAAPPFYSLYATSWASVVHLMSGEFARAAEIMEPALCLAQENDLAVALPGAYIALGVAYSGLGRVESGLDLAEYGLALAEQSRILMYYVYWLVLVAEASLIAGKLDRASELADRALGMARERGERGQEAWALHLIGGVAAAQGSDGAKHAESYWRAAITQATELGMRPLVAHCHFGLGKMYRATGDHDQALGHLTTATTMYREMGMTYWLEQVETQLRGV
jgi:tetratricopeptide (TPR) repeat protein